jgi:precorrin-4 methylase
MSLDEIVAESEHAEADGNDVVRSRFGALSVWCAVGEQLTSRRSAAFGPNTLSINGAYAKA